MPTDRSKIALWLIHKAFKHFYFLQMSGVWIIQISIKRSSKQALSPFRRDVLRRGRAFCRPKRTRVAFKGWYQQSAVFAISRALSGPLTNLSLQIFASNTSLSKNKSTLAVVRYAYIMMTLYKLRTVELNLFRQVPHLIHSLNNIPWKGLHGALLISCVASIQVLLMSIFF